jgi:hypothetical protein
LTCGVAGEIIITGQDLVLEPPLRNRMIQIPDPNNAGQFLDQAMYPDNARGDNAFERYEKRYDKWKEGKKKLMSKLLSCTDKDVKDSLTTSPGYQQMYDQFDILGIWAEEPYQCTHSLCDC